MTALARDQRTLVALFRIYCCHHHYPDSASELCSTCQGLQDYALQRLAHCRWAPNKPVCRHCSSPCYAPQPRQAIQAIMRWAGPRLIWRHPVWAMRHVIQRWVSSTP